MKHHRDVFDEMFEHPELTLRQADWKVNRHRKLMRWALQIFPLVLIAFGWADD